MKKNYLKKGFNLSKSLVRAFAPISIFILILTSSNSFAQTYCNSTSNNADDEYIGRVQLGSIDNSSTNESGGYSDFTSQSTSLTKGESYTLNINPVWTGVTYSEGYAAWIDYNQDGDFADANEQIFAKPAGTDNSVSTSFTIPNNASLGTTRIRVSMKYNGVPNSCESFQWGEVEDYTVLIGDLSTSDTEAPSAPDNLTSSNVTTSSVSLSWSASTDNVGVTEYVVYRDDVQTNTTTSNTFNVSGLTANTAYNFKVNALDAAGNVSGFSNTTSVTTNQGENIPPSVSLSTSEAITTAPATITLTANASDSDGNISLVEFFNGSRKLGEDNASPYTFQWSNIAVGNYTLTAIATDNENSTSTSTEVSLTVIEPASINYCTANSTNTNDEFIEKVQLAGINNQSNASSGGYGDFTNLIANVTQGVSNTITITPSWTGTVYNEGYSVWIDYNQDGDFSDNGEQVVSISPTNNTSVSGDFTVPTSSTLGLTRIRVIMQYNVVTSSPCGSFQWGEVEDYTVNILEDDGTTDTEDPSVPVNLASSNVTTTSVSLSWSASTDNVGVTEYAVYRDDVQTNTTTSTSFNVNGLTANTTYNFKVSALDAAGNVSAFSNTISVTTNEETNGGNYSAEILELLDLLNQARQDNGLAALTLNAQLTAAAVFHANDMINNNFFSHTGSNGSSGGARISNQGYVWSTWGENIANGQQTSQDVHTAWMNSPGHRANILGAQFSEVGLAHEGTYWVQVFASPSSGGTSASLTYRALENKPLGQNVIIYPNPVKGNSVTIGAEINDGDKLTVEVRSINGSFLYKVETIGNRLDVSNLSSGIYILIIRVGNVTSIKRLVVAK